MVIVIILGASILCCCVLLTFGCVCHLFKRGHGFSSFENDAETGRGVSMYSTSETSLDASTNNITFEPLPDILAKTVGSRALRPRITCIDKDKQEAAAKLVTVYHPFPRNQLLYVKEIGLGWFGQVLQGTADNILQDKRQTKVVVKILKDDATNAEKSLFLEELAPYRDLEYSHILGLLGQCTEASPYLAILELPSNGDLKAYLQTQKTGPFIQFAIDTAKGLSYLHSHSYVHHDLAARNCLLTSDLHVKIGDYGIGEDLYREDYYDTGCDLLPIRWMSPESMELKNGVWQLTQFTIQSNVWSLSILLWEILAEGRKPYNNLKDEDVLQRVIKEGTSTLPLPTTETPLRDRWYEIMEMCWQEVNDRPSTDDILAFLQQIDEESKHTPAVNLVSPPLNSKQVVHGNQTGANSPKLFESNFVQIQTRNQSTNHVAEVLVHRADDQAPTKLGFEDDFSQSVQIRQNRNGVGFEDDFVSGNALNLNSSDIAHNDSILAFGGNDPESSKESILSQDIPSVDKNLNVLTEPVPVKMSTPNKPSLPIRHNKSEGPNTAKSQITQKSAYLSTSDEQQVLSQISDEVKEKSEHIDNLIDSKENIDNKSANQITDEGYRTELSGEPVSPVALVERKSDSNIQENQGNELLDMSVDPEIEKAKEIYMSMGASLPTSFVHKSRLLGTIPEDGIPSDNTSQSGFVFDDPEAEDTAMTFEWDDYDVEKELVGRVRFPSDDSIIASRSPRHVEVEDWPFEQDSESEPRSKPGSLASDSDTEVTGQSIGSDTSLDTRSRIASILTNRLNSVITNRTNVSFASSKSMFYSFSDDDLESPEHNYTDRRNMLYDQSSLRSSASSEDLQGEVTTYDSDGTDNHQTQDDNLIKQDLDTIAASVLQKPNQIKVIVSEPHDSMLSTSPANVIA